MSYLQGSEWQDTPLIGGNLAKSMKF